MFGPRSPWRLSHGRSRRQQGPILRWDSCLFTRHSHTLGDPSYGYRPRGDVPDWSNLFRFRRRQWTVDALPLGNALAVAHRASSRSSESPTETHVRAIGGLVLFAPETFLGARLVAGGISTVADLATNLPPRERKKSPNCRKQFGRYFELNLWCRKWDSNPHAFKGGGF